MEPDMDHLCDSIFFNKAHDMLRKARKHESGGYKTILERCHDDDELSQVFVRYWVDWGTDHSIWPIALEMEINQSLLHNKSGNGLINNVKASKRMAILSFLQDDAFIFVITLASDQRLEVSSTLGFVANIILDCTVFFFLFRETMYFLAIDGGECRQHTYRAPHFLMHSCGTDVFFFHLLSECSVTRWPPCTFMAQVTKHIVCVSPKNIHTSSSSRNVVHLAEPGTTHGHSFLTFSWISLPATWATLRRSTAPAEWRPDGINTSYILWRQGKFPKLQTPRPAPKVTLMRNWQKPAAATAAAAAAHFTHRLT